AIPDGYGGGGVTARQTGGTNFSSSIRVGDNDGSAGYTLSNGVVISSGTRIGTRGGFNHAGGTHLINGTLDVHGGFINRGDITIANYTLGGGFLSSTSVVIQVGL